MEKLLNVENDWDSAVDVLRRCDLVVSFRKKRLQQLLKDKKLKKQLVLVV